MCRHKCLLKFNNRRFLGGLEAFGLIDGDLKLFGSKLESDDVQVPIGDLPLCQGVISPSHLKPNYQFDEIEEQLWGFELANEKQGFFASLFKTIKAAF